MKYFFQKSNISGQLLWPSFIFLLFAFFITACGNLEKEINLDLPAYQPQYVVECYLEPGQPFTLLLTRSSAYFDPFPTDPLAYVENILVDSAEVVITHNGVDYNLANTPFLNPSTLKVANYYSSQLVPEDFDNDFALKITLSNGQTITSTTRILPVVPIDSVVVEFDDVKDTLARCLTYLTDDPSTVDYYRRMIHQNSLVDSIPDQDFTTNDDYVDDKVIVFGTGYDYKEGDTIYNTMFHIERAYFDFWNSTFNAINSNGNPFGQPSSIVSNVESSDGRAVGIFTGLSYDRIMTVVTK
ncbi:MAG: DUF4249 domain-containing protein [Saprospiraceae bacterium]|nr:DUF4249 domain-containing protein [Saprospiraceae bacterium]